MNIADTDIYHIEIECDMCSGEYECDEECMCDICNIARAESRGDMYNDMD